MADEARGSSESAEQETEYGELLGFLTDKKVEVQMFAAQGILDLTESQEFLAYCQRHPRDVARPLLRLAERTEADAVVKGAADVAAAAAKGRAQDKATEQAAMEARAAEEAGASALKALVNLSAVPVVREELVSLSAPRRCAEALRAGWLEGSASLAHWHAMLLANLTTGAVGQEALCAEEVLLRFLLAAYVAKPRPEPRDGYNDPLRCLGKAIGNACALREGRRLLAGGEAGPAAVATLATELADRARRPDVLGALRNICLDEECHSAVTATDLLARMALFLYPWGKVEAEHRAALPEQFREALETGGAALTGDATVRSAAAVCVLGLCSSREGREYLRGQHFYEVLRAWHSQESVEETRNTLEASMPSAHLSEEAFLEERARLVREQEEPAEGDVPADLLDGVDGSEGGGGSDGGGGGSAAA